MTDDKELDLFFAAAREGRPMPSADLMARVMADAYEAQPAPVALVNHPSAKPSRLLQGLAGMVQALGGKGGLAGLCSAAIAGVWLGYSGPLDLDWLTGAFLASGVTEVEMIAADDLFLNEG